MSGCGWPLRTCSMLCAPTCLLDMGAAACLLTPHTFCGCSILDVLPESFNNVEGKGPLPVVCYCTVKEEATLRLHA